MYQPKLGRFMSRDPLPENGPDIFYPVPDMRKYWKPATEPYVYVENNPVNLADPSGLGPCDPAKTLETLDPRAVATIRCKEGKLEAIIVKAIDPKTGRVKDPCVLDCTIVHEEFHISQVDKWCPDFCTGCDREGLIPKIPDNLSPPAAECPAYLAGRNCLVRHLRQPAGCDRIAIIEAIGGIDDIVRDPTLPYQCLKIMPWPLPPI